MLTTPAAVLGAAPIDGPEFFPAATLVYGGGFDEDSKSALQAIAD
jgi:hypothetical protein